MMRSEAKTVDAYLSELPEDRRSALTTVRDLIREVAPRAEESMNYGMPTYDQAGPLFAFASQKRYMALYVMDTDLVESYRARLGKLDVGKSCIRFRRIGNLPLDVVEDLLREAVSRHRTQDRAV
jgi:uncharacterized protein YdhG (YjbR/CyaY superfamily)